MKQTDTINIQHGSGGRSMHSFIQECIISKLKNGILERMDDSAILSDIPQNSKIAMTTDSYVVSPLFFPNGDIGKLCIAGTINDLTTSGAKPIALSLSFILEEGVKINTINKIVDSIAETAIEAGVKIVTGDTKVVEKGKGDQIYINTCGIGVITENISISTYNAENSDLVFVTGPIGNHEVAMLKARNMINFDISVNSDVAPLNRQIQDLIKKNVQLKTIKDPTRGGIASALNEICDHSNVTITIMESNLPIDKDVAAVCELIGFDPLYLANEGKFIIIAPPISKNEILTTFPQAKVIGEVSKTHETKSNHLLMETKSGGIRRIGMMETMQLPRIC